MNAKQSLRECAKNLEIAEAALVDLHTVVGRAEKDIKAYVQCILGMIQGGSPCEWCEEQNECQLQAKADGKGCDQWWLRYEEEDENAPVQEDSGHDTPVSDRQQ